ncbi:hypothetical protein D9758_007219 [Tetrapyrgos nigripes]|uniref:RNI-like protein n=1 Tax=Tetrapyrgos nigripes TaxID=182062 RepID=A0A8H5D2I9_9AGAR|nr:hypothetical protein D9758_007219 [Tetrapyrgos nigripes]
MRWALGESDGRHPESTESEPNLSCLLSVTYPHHHLLAFRGSSLLVGSFEMVTTEPFKCVERHQQEATKWADEFRQALTLMENAHTLDTNLMELPRRKAADPAKAALANEIARLLYPDLAIREDSLGPIIRYEKDLVKLRAYIQAQITQQNSESISTSVWAERILRLGPWDEGNDPVSLEGASSLPMPVQISDGETLAPFFNHLRMGGDDSIVGDEDAEEKLEPFYDVHMVEFPKGVLYADRRMDLCKMVVGPTHIGGLMDSLESNPFTEHFLLGNNIIGPLGAQHIAAFIHKYPDRMTTWYLAGNCIDGPSFKLLVDSLVKSPPVTNLWFKRNPLGPSAAHDLFRLIIQTPQLRTLDLDQTSLGDAGVASLFSLLAEYKSDVPLALRHIYLNGTGIGEAGAKAIARYLAAESCTLVSLYASNNPLGDKGATALAAGLSCNKTLQRLALSSNGLKDHGTSILLKSLLNHPALRLLDLVSLIRTVTTLRYLTLDLVPITRPHLNEILSAVAESDLLYFTATPLEPQGRDIVSVKAGQTAVRLREMVAKRLAENIAKEYDGISMHEFYGDGKRFLVSPEDVRYIDSVYRNRDAQMARRGLKKLDKWWQEGMGRWV